jgi:hypothetical protein
VKRCIVGRPQDVASDLLEFNQIIIKKNHERNFGLYERVAMKSTTLLFQQLTPELETLALAEIGSVSWGNHAGWV